MSGGSCQEQTAAELLGECLQRFPPVRHAFAYGSGVFHQPGLYQPGGEASPKPMVDFIFVVDDPRLWHSENIAENRAHYSFLASFGASALCASAERVGVGVHFNTLVPWNSRMIKYGVVGLDTLRRDLLEWESLYVAGRMHKPVLTLQEDAAVADAAAQNLHSAVRSALLMLPRQFTTEDLMHALCGLSYSGDVRQGIAEDAGKVAKIVGGSGGALRELYDGALRGPAAMAAGLQQVEPGVWQQDCGAQSRADLIRELPKGVLSGLAARLPSPAEGRSEAVAAAVAETGRHGAMLQSTLSSIVRRSSARQTAYGALAVGLSKSAQYLGAKLAKAWRPRS